MPFPTFSPIRGKAKDTAGAVGTSGIAWSSFPLGKSLSAGMALGWRRGQFPPDQVALNPFQPGLDL